MRKFLLTIALSLLPLTALAAPVSWDGNFSTQIVQPLKAFWGATIQANNFNATSTTATSTFSGNVNIAGGLEMASGGYIYDGHSHIEVNESSGTHIGYGTGSNHSNFVITSGVFQWINAGLGELMRLDTTGLAIGTTTPEADFHISRLDGTDTEILFTGLGGADTSTATTSPTAGASVSCSGTVSWVNASNILSSNNSDASTNGGSISGGQTTDCLQASTFGFAIPTGATVEGIAVQIEKQASLSNIDDLSVRLLKASVLTGSDYASATDWPAADAYSYYGGATDMWGTTWTPAEINATGFGVSLRAYHTGGLDDLPTVDHMAIKVYYTEGVTKWVTGIDNADNQNFKISTSTEFGGTNDLLELDSDTGSVTITHDLDIAEGLNAGTANAFSVTSTGAVDTNSSLTVGSANQYVVSSSGIITAIAGLSGASGTYNFENVTSFELPNAAAPTTDAFGEIAGDNNAWASGRGAIQAYDGTANTWLIGALTSDTPTNGQVPKWNTGGTITWEDDGGGSGGGGTAELQWASVYNNTTQTIGNFAWVSLTHNTEIDDDQGWHSTVSDTDRVTVDSDGLYQITCYVAYDVNTSGSRWLRATKGGVAIVGGQTNDASIATWGRVLTVTVFAEAVATNYFTCETFQDSSGGANRSASGAIQVVRVPDGNFGSENIFTLTDATTVQATSTNSGIGLKVDYVIATSTTATSTAVKFNVNAGANATSTATIGQLGLTSSKACVNMNNTSGNPTSFYFVGVTMIIEPNYCR